jgi:putative oxidoreductase
MNAGRLIARLTIGGLFAAHGTQKLFGWFGGSGLGATAETMDKLELRPARRNALAAGGAETAGGVLLALGALTPLAGSLLTSTMVTAIRKVHGPKGPWNTAGGYEYNLTLIAATMALVDAGPGTPSVDRALDMERRGTAWTVASLALGVAGSTLAIEASKRLAAQEEQAAVEQEPNQGATGRFTRATETSEREQAGTSA